MSAPKNFVITGSTRGIGRGVAAELLKRGHSVAISGRSQVAVDATLTDLAAYAAGDAKLVGTPADVSRTADLQRLWDESKRPLGRIDVWVNNAGISHPRQPIGELHTEDVNAVEETNLLGMMLATQIAMREMTTQPEGGTIYNMEGFGSTGMKTRGMSLYGATKYALTYFNKCLIEETRGSKVRICYLSPGIVVTDLLKRDMGSTTAEEWERTKRIYNILADRVETVTPYLAEGLIANEKHGGRVAWLTGKKAAFRFMTASIRKRKIIEDADLQAT